MVVHYPNTVWKNIYAEQEVPGETYNKNEKGTGGQPGIEGGACTMRCLITTRVGNKDASRTFVLMLLMAH